MCTRCAKVADIIEWEGHQHFLFFDFKCEEKCNGCGAYIDEGAFRCGKCRFDLDFGCLTLPHSTLHKIDEHKLKLTYHDDKEQSYCDICEQYRDPSLWYYSCSICDTSAHIECVLGQFPFLKDGVTFASLNALIVESFAKKKFSSVKTLHATILSTANTIVVGVTKPKALW
ncbi:hypothetical protein Gotur_025230 [Gossypium turneri]